MLDSDLKLRHLPFFEEIAGLEAESAECRAATAGLVTLRLVDSWLESGLSLKEDSWSVPHVRKAIREMDEGTPLRSMLLRVVDALRSRKPDIHAVVAQLMAYGQVLEYDAHWLLAGDVYQTLLAHLHPIEDSEASIAAHIRLGMCYRNRHLLEEAASAYSAASNIASTVNDLDGVLRARIGEASLARLRGNLPEADAILVEAVARATGPDLREVRAKALGERSGVAVLGGQFELGIRLAYDALVQIQSPTDRDRILNNIAVAFTHLGVYSAAQDAYLVLSATAQEQYMRWAATLNLLDVSSRIGSETLFENYRQQLTGEPLPPHLSTAFELSLGNGYKRFGSTDKARTHLERAAAIASEHALNQYLIEAAEALDSLKTPTPPRQVSAKIPLDLEEVASVIRGMRESAGTA